MSTYWNTSWMFITYSLCYFSVMSSKSLQQVSSESGCPNNCLAANRDIPLHKTGNTEEFCLSTSGTPLVMFQDEWLQQASEECMIQNLSSHHLQLWRSHLQKRIRQQQDSCNHIRYIQLSQPNTDQTTLISFANKTNIVFLWYEDTPNLFISSDQWTSLNVSASSINLTTVWVESRQYNFDFE